MGNFFLYIYKKKKRISTILTECIRYGPRNNSLSLVIAIFNQFNRKIDFFKISIFRIDFSHLIKSMNRLIYLKNRFFFFFIISWVTFKHVLIFTFYVIQRLDYFIIEVQYLDAVV